MCMEINTEKKIPNQVEGLSNAISSELTQAWQKVVQCAHHNLACLNYSAYANTEV